MGLLLSNKYEVKRSVLINAPVSAIHPLKKILTNGPNGRHGKQPIRKYIFKSAKLVEALVPVKNG